MPEVALVCRFTVAFVLLRVGGLKFRDIGGFRAAVGEYGLVPARLVDAVALFVPTVELLCGGLLLPGAATGPVAAVVAALMVTFSVAVAVNLLRGRKIGCGCAGRASSEIGWRHVGNNLVLTLMAVITSAWARMPLSIWPAWGARADAFLAPDEALAVLLAVGMGGAAGLLVREGLFASRTARRSLAGSSASGGEAREEAVS
jgi:putative oxidoreductase